MKINNSETEFLSVKHGQYMLLIKFEPQITNFSLSKLIVLHTLCWSYEEDEQSDSFIWMAQFNFQYDSASCSHLDSVGGVGNANGTQRGCYCYQHEIKKKWDFWI